jgi:hypothetical protein
MLTAFLVVFALLGTVGAIAVSFMVTKAYCVDDAPQTAETRPEVAPPTKTAPVEPPPVAVPTPQPPLPNPPTAPPVVAEPNEPPTKLQPGSVLIDSDPRGAKVILNGIDIGQVTPTSIPLDKTAHVEIRLDGYLSTSKIFRPGQPTLFFRLEKARTEGSKAATKTSGKGFADWAKHLQQQQEQNQ